MTSPDPLPSVRLKIARRSSHPWIFQKMVEKPDRKLPPGSVVDIVERDGQWVGRGLYNGHSRIALRVLTDLYLQKRTHPLEDERHYTELALRALHTAYGLDAD